MYPPPDPAQLQSVQHAQAQAQTQTQTQMYGVMKGPKQTPAEESKRRNEMQKPQWGAAQMQMTRERSNSDASGDRRKEEEGQGKYMSSTDCSIDSRNSSFKEEQKDIRPSDDAEEAKDPGPLLPPHAESLQAPSTTGNKLAGPHRPSSWSPHSS
jgi:hypothetical protein